MDTQTPSEWEPGLNEEPQCDPDIVLVVDDEQVLRSVVARALARFGYQVIMAGNGREALTMLATPLKFSLVLLDVDMPEMNGLDALPFIRRAAPGVPVAFMTGHLSDDSAVGVLHSGADAVIPKPFDLKQLVLAVERIIERRKLTRATNGSRVA